MKYMGSKARLSKDISLIINKLIQENNIDTYIEPFVGGCNIIDKIKCKNKIGHDINEYLIEMWNGVINGWNPPPNITKEDYIKIKNNKDLYDKKLVAVTGFCATYNAKWFGGYAGIVKTKIGTERNYYDESIRNILNQKEKLNNVTFINDSFENISAKNSLIYCDPPYEGTTQYNNNKFNYEIYWDKVREWTKDNIVLCSEYNAPNDFICIFEKTLTTTLDKNSRKKDTEKLFIHNSQLKYIKE